MKWPASILILIAMASATPSITPYPDVIGECFADGNGKPYCAVNFAWNDYQWTNVTMQNVTACNTCPVIGNSTIEPPMLGYDNTTAFPDARGCRLTQCELYENRPMCEAATC